MWHMFTEPSRRVMFYAQEEARNCESARVASEHILLGLMTEEDWKPAKALAELNCTIERVRPAAKKLRKGLAPPSHVPLVHSEESKGVVETATEFAKDTSSGAILPEHIFLALFSHPEFGASKILTDLGITREAAESSLQGM